MTRRLNFIYLHRMAAWYYYLLQYSLKGILLHNGVKQPLISMALFFVDMKRNMLYYGIDFQVPLFLELQDDFSRYCCVVVVLLNQCITKVTLIGH